MKVALVSVGSRGDIQPYIALGRRLRACGHQVRVAGVDPYRGLVESAGLDFCSLGPMPGQFRKRAQDDGAKKRRDGSARFEGVLGRALFWGIFPHLLRPYLDRFVEACRGVDAVMYSRLALPVPHVAESMGVPCFEGFPVPHCSNGDFANPLYASWERLGDWAVRASYTVEWQLTHQLSYGTMARFRRWLGLGPVGRRRLREHADEHLAGTLYGYSEHVLPRPSSWSQEKVAVTGYWFDDGEASDWEPPASLEAFLARGAGRTICVGFGSMKPHRPGRLLEMFERALERLDLQAVVLAGSGGFERCGSKRMMVLEGAPHSWLFPKVEAVVHHGGAGTTAAALKAGCPAVVVPFAFDQPFWGQRLARLGVAAGPIHEREVTVQKLVEALGAVTGDVQMRRRAQAVGARLAAEDGVGQAVAALERWCREGEGRGGGLGRRPVRRAA